MNDYPLSRLALACLLCWSCQPTEETATTDPDVGEAPTTDAEITPGTDADLGPDEAPDVGPKADSGAPDAGAEADMGEPASFPIQPGTQRGTLESGGRERTFNIRIPPGYDGSQPLPLLLVFHGGNGDGALIQGALGFDAFTDRDGAIAVYPDGVEKNWADGRGTTDASREGVDDLGFVLELIAYVSRHLNVDDQKVWATGVSNGGFFTQHLACELSERLAAVAPVISALPSAAKDTCLPTKALPMLAIQGTLDPFITFEGGDSSHDRLDLGDGGAIESSEATRAFWAQRYGCSAPTVTALDPVDEGDPTRVELHAYRGCSEGARIDYYIVEGMGHVWPPNDPVSDRISGPTSTQLDATELIWAFFTEGS